MGLNLTGSSVRAAVIGMLALSLVQALPLTVAEAQDGASGRDAAMHFQRGVTLYGETDYRGALVEFNRAYALAPSRVVLYNLGQTDYQLHDYAGALTMFERYLAEAGPADSHRSELEHAVKELRSRVGRIAVTTVPPGAEVSVDDRVIGKTPFERPAIVSIGRLKVSASSVGRSTVSRYVDIAADDSVSLTLELPAAETALAMTRLVPTTTSTFPAEGVTSAPLASDPERSRAAAARWRTAGWIATGVLAAGAVGFGIVALKESSDLRAERDVFPATMDLKHRASLTSTYALLTDACAAAAVVVAGVTLYSTVTSGTETTSASMTVGFSSLDVRVKF